MRASRDSIASESPRSAWQKSTICFNNIRVIISINIERVGCVARLFRLASVISSRGVVQHFEVDGVLRQVDVAHDAAADEAIVDRRLDETSQQE